MAWAPVAENLLVMPVRLEHVVVDIERFLVDTESGGGVDGAECSFCYFDDGYSIVRSGLLCTLHYMLSSLESLKSRVPGTERWR